VIEFKFRPGATGGYAVEGLDATSEVFANFVNFDTYGAAGVRELLVRVHAILAGTAPPLDERRNTYEIVSDELTTRVAFRDESASCATTEFAAFLDEILNRLDAAGR
jgi:glutamate/tyrosine decarboxylase-like PLP-dependent enzyme